MGLTLALMMASFGLLVQLQLKIAMCWLRKESQNQNQKTILERWSMIC
jgi:hypothetical protein